MSLVAIPFVADPFQCAIAECECVSLLVQQESEEPAEEVEGYDEEEESAPSRKKAKVASQDTPMKSPVKPVDKVYSKKKSQEEEPKVTPAKKGPGRPKKSLDDSGKKDSTKVKKRTPKKSTPTSKEKGTDHLLFTVERTYLILGFVIPSGTYRLLLAFLAVLVETGFIKFHVFISEMSFVTSNYGH